MTTMAMAGAAARLKAASMAGRPEAVAHRTAAVAPHMAAAEERRIPSPAAIPPATVQVAAAIPAGPP
jgi:hypothetical protein